MLSTVVAQIEQLIAQIEASGPVAAADARRLRYIDAFQVRLRVCQAA